MASINGFTKERMLGIEGSSIVDGYINTYGHLILVKHDGTTIDAGTALAALPAASTAQPGIVELATTAETNARSDTARAITPAGFAATYNDLNGRLNTLASSAVSLDGRLDVVEATWPTVVHCPTLDPTVYVESTAMTAYPVGNSRIYMTEAQTIAGGWNFAKGNNEVITYYDNVAGYAKQTRSLISLDSGVALPAIWVRTGNSGGWSSWRIVVDDAILPNPKAVTYTSTNSVTATSWANLQHDQTFDLVLARDAVVFVTMSCWIGCTVGNEVRAGISIDSSSPQYNTGSMWGDVSHIGISNGGVDITGDSKHTSVELALSAGTHTFRIKAYTNIGSTAACNYTSLRATAIRWAEA